jgi:hypothetical protein
MAERYIAHAVSGGSRDYDFESHVKHKLLYMSSE